MTVKLQTEQRLEFLSLKGGCTGSPESTLVKMPHCWKTQVTTNTVKTLYNVTRYNRIFNIRHKIAGDGSVSIKIPSLYQNIHLTTPTVTSGNRYISSIENKFIITELLPCVRQFCDQNKVFLHEQVLSHLISGKLCAF